MIDRDILTSRLDAGALRTRLQRMIEEDDADVVIDDFSDPAGIMDGVRVLDVSLSSLRLNSGHTGSRPGRGSEKTFFDGLSYREIDGSGNHDLDYGSTGTVLKPVAGYGYSDGYNSPADDGRPGAREISNMIFAQDGVDIPSPVRASNFLWMWGQFLDHDIDLTLEGEELYNISIPTGDAYFDPLSTGTVEMPFHRSQSVEGSGEGEAYPREHVNEITAFIDASNVYGSDPAREAELRDEGGYLKMSEDGFLPYNTAGLPNANGNPMLSDSDLFLAGDVRVNETVALTSMHTLFVREHNRLVDVLKDQYPHMDDEALYQNAKAIVEAEMQAITYNEFLPLLLGENALEAYEGYNPSVDPVITAEFSTAAYRLGHSMLNALIARLNEDGSVDSNGDLDLRDSFFNPAEIAANGIEGIFRGQAATTSQAIDAKVVDDVRNFLFGEPGEGGFDLVALNIQRGRDHGLKDLNSVREAYGLEAYTSFEQITDDPVLAQKLEDLYGDINYVDLFVGGLAENHMEGALVGETFQAILVHQFSALRDGDSFWYQDRFEGEILEDLESVTLSKIIARNTDIDYMQHDLFVASERHGGTAEADVLDGGEYNDLLLGFEGADQLYGHEGDDTLYGGAGNDRLEGGDGNDYLAGESGRDMLDGGGGDDVLAFGRGDSYQGGEGQDTLYFSHDSNHPLSLSLMGIEGGIDVLDFNNGERDRVFLEVEDILSLTDDGILFVLGDDGIDQVMAPDFAGAGEPDVVEADGVEYALYQDGGAMLYVEAGLLGPAGWNTASEDQGLPQALV